MSESNPAIRFLDARLRKRTWQEPASSLETWTLFMDPNPSDGTDFRCEDGSFSYPNTSTVTSFDLLLFRGFLFFLKFPLPHAETTTQFDIRDDSQRHRLVKT